MFKELGIFVAMLLITCVLAYLVNQFLVAQLILLILCWIGFFSFEYAINGGSLKTDLISDFEYFGFNGQAKRTEFAKLQLSKDYDNTIITSKRSWSSKEEYTEKEYIECGNDILGSGYYFWISKFLIPFSIATYLIY
jgi:hypothetical protein